MAYYTNHEQFYIDLRAAARAIPPRCGAPPFHPGHYIICRTHVGLKYCCVAEKSREIFRRGESGSMNARTSFIYLCSLPF